MLIPQLLTLFIACKEPEQNFTEVREEPEEYSADLDAAMEVCIPPDPNQIVPQPKEEEGDEEVSDFDLSTLLSSLKFQMGLNQFADSYTTALAGIIGNDSPDMLYTGYVMDPDNLFYQQRGALYLFDDRSSYTASSYILETLDSVSGFNDIIEDIGYRGLYNSCGAYYMTYEISDDEGSETKMEKIKLEYEYARSENKTVRLYIEILYENGIATYLNVTKHYYNEGINRFTSEEFDADEYVISPVARLLQDYYVQPIWDKAEQLSSKVNPEGVSFGLY